MNLNGDSNCADGEAKVSEDIEATLVFDAYLASTEAGHPPDLEKLLAEHPALADRLKTLVAASNRIASIAGDVVPSFEDYRIVRELGRGGMGIVYEANQISRGRHVAIKVLTAAAAMDPQQLTRFRQVEVPTAQLLRHPHIVPITDFGCEHGVYFYAMQFIDGQNLAQRIKTVPSSGGVETAAGDMASRFGVVHAKGAALSSQAEASLPSPMTNADDWCRKAARWGLQVAAALDFAHQQGVIHRDIKPSNLLLDGRENIWITDFGLAHIQGEAHLTATGDLPGTPRYMSPEQILARRVVVDHRTDIYSLGATLYELLVFRPAFEGDNRQDVMRRVVEEEPRAPRRVNPAIPRDLETIIQKAMAKERDDRYKTAQDMAEGLRRFLDRKAIQARRPSLMDRASRWAQRHRRMVVSSVVALILGVIGLSIGTALIAGAERREVAAGTLAEAHSRESQCESLMQQILRLRLTTHLGGWSVETWNLVRQASRLQAQPKTDRLLQGSAIATLSDFDARAVKRFDEFGARFVAFDRIGQRLLMGSTTDPKHPDRTLGTKLWDDATQQLSDLAFDGEGPVGFRIDGTPIAFVADTKAGTLALWDLATKRILLPFEVPGQLDVHKITQLSMLPDGSLVAAPVTLAGGQSALVVWNGETGKRLHQLQGKTSCVALSPDRSLVAGGDETGHITIWSLSTGRVEAILSNGRSSIRCLAYGADRHRSGRDVRVPAGTGWLVAAGDAGGTITVWELGTNVPRAYCRGSYYDVYSVAFSPDGATLASAGRHVAKLWDATTGRHLLDLSPGDETHGLAFSPDGRRLAIGHSAWSGVTVDALENGRGTLSLRGLSSQVAHVAFSADGRTLAALSQDWRIAIWDADTGHLKHLLDAPRGLVADHAAIAFGLDGHRFAAATGGETSGAAIMWDLDSGRELKTWTLPPGLHDTLAFNLSGNLISCRCETTDGRHAPFGDATPQEYPRVCRIRNLTASDPATPIVEFCEFNWAVDAIVASPDAAYFVVVGRGGPQGKRVLNKVVDGPTGKFLGEIPMTRSVRYGHVLPMDPGGKVLAISTSNDDSQRTLFAMPSIKMLRTINCGLNVPSALGPGAHLWSGQYQHSGPRRYALWQGNGQHMATLGLDSRISSTPAFDSDGERFAWGSAEGVVFIADLRKIQSRLAEVNLGW
jgi:eukaryotic-like serine/threonine-protein kinase